MNRTENLKKIVTATRGSKLEASFPGLNAEGSQVSIPGIRWASITLPRLVDLQIALTTMITVSDLALEHRLLLGDRNIRNVMLSPVDEIANGKILRDKNGVMRIVQVDFEEVETTFDGFDLISVLLGCINELAPSGRPDLHLDVTEISEMIRTNYRQKSIGQIAIALRRDLEIVRKQPHLVSLPDDVIARNRR